MSDEPGAVITSHRPSMPRRTPAEAEAARTSIPDFMKHRDVLEVARRVRRLHQGPARQVGQDGQGRRHPAGITSGKGGRDARTAASVAIFRYFPDENTLSWLCKWGVAPCVSLHSDEVIANIASGEIIAVRCKTPQ